MVWKDETRVYIVPLMIKLIQGSPMGLKEGKDGPEDTSKRLSNTQKPLVRRALSESRRAGSTLICGTLIVHGRATCSEMSSLDLCLFWGCFEVLFLCSETQLISLPQH